MGFRVRNGYTDSLDGLIVALCRDYERRACGSSVKRVEMEYKYINTRLFEAVSEVVGLGNARTLIDEIGSHVGYANSRLDELSETSYKKLKQEVKLAIARKLYLLD